MSIRIQNYLDGSTRQDSIRARHISRPLQVCPCLVYGLAVSFARSVGIPSPGNVLGVGFDQDNQTRVKRFQDSSRRSWPDSILGPHEHVSIYDQSRFTSSLSDFARGLLLDLTLEFEILAAHMVTMNCLSAFLEELVHYVSKIDDLQWDVLFACDGLQFL